MSSPDLKQNALQFCFGANIQGAKKLKKLTNICLISLQRMRCNGLQRPAHQTKKQTTKGRALLEQYAKTTLIIVFLFSFYAPMRNICMKQRTLGAGSVGDLP